MADGDDRNRRKPNSSGDGGPDWKETCIGVWSKSTRGHQVTEAEQDKICNGISFVVLNKVRFFFLHRLFFVMITRSS